MNNTGRQKSPKYNIKKGIINATVQVVLDEASSLWSMIWQIKEQFFL